MIAVVPQTPALFAGTIMENIAPGEEDPDSKMVIEICEKLGMTEFIASLPLGLESPVGEGGASLSGGQRQRILMARALYRRPMVLILDEATSHLDVERERLVNAAVSMLELTRIIVAHRPETIASADRVLVMEGGRIVHDYRPAAKTEPRTREHADITD